MHKTGRIVVDCSNNGRPNGRGQTERNRSIELPKEAYQEAPRPFYLQTAYYQPHYVLKRPDFFRTLRIDSVSINSR